MKGFPGGEKKKAEILQMAILEPSLAILDETIRDWTSTHFERFVRRLVGEKPEQSIPMITHYERMLRYLKPDHIHIMMEGKIVLSGGWS